MTCGPGSPGTLPPRWPRPSPRCGPAPVTPPNTRPGSHCGSWAGAWSSPTASSSGWTSSSSRSSPPARPACSPCTASARTPPRCCWSRPGTTRNGCAARPPGRTCAGSRRSRPRRGRCGGTGLISGGNREANHALWRIVITRMSSHPATRAYVERRTQRGPVQEGDHPLPEALRRPRGLPPPARRLTLPSSRGGLARESAAATGAGLRSIRRPPRAPLSRTPAEPRVT